MTALASIHTRPVLRYTMTFSLPIGPDETPEQPTPSCQPDTAFL